MSSSLRGALLRRLVPPLVGLLLVQGAGFYFLVHRPAIRAYDRALGNSALALSRLVDASGANVALALPHEAEGLLRTDRFDRIYYAVHDPGGVTISGDAGIPPPNAASSSSDGPLMFYDARFASDDVRAAAVLTKTSIGNVTTIVAETTGKRRGLMYDLLLNLLISLAVFAAMFYWLIRYGVDRGLVSLDVLKRQIEARSSADLSPLDESLAVSEVRPLVAGMNDLLQRLKAAGEGRRRFLADAAHQLRTPLAGLGTQFDLALAHPEVEGMRAHLLRCRGAIQQTSRLVNQLLALYAVEPGGRPPMEKSPVDLQALIEEQASRWVLQTLPFGTDLGFELAPALVSGDGLELTEMLTNLIDNAARYGGEGCVVTVRCGTEGARAFVEVEDSGPGIAAEHLAHVRERFFRVPGTTGVGGGLGLAIVEEIVMRHGAELELAAGRHGRGLRARVVFGGDGRDMPGRKS